MRVVVSSQLNSTKLRQFGAVLSTRIFGGCFFEGWGLENKPALPLKKSVDFATLYEMKNSM